MRLLDYNYRGDPRFVLRRIERAATSINVFLRVIAVALAILDLLCLARNLLDTLPPESFLFGLPAL